ncbi:MAG: hypothetical protein HYR62_02545 [Actinobacteria bacterium]|nr:hypothetical protein [Actinomycetota bacterium]MBI3687355.1 hypothetical protein [Actinomycetota bacterium]
MADGVQTSPLRRVLARLGEGATPAEIAETLQLPSDVVNAMVDHWVRVGAIVVTELRSGCAPPGGCAGCAAAATGAIAGRHCPSSPAGIR